MAVKEHMGWVRSMNRWQKRYRGKLYTVSPRQLGIEPKTRSASREAANGWWEKKRTEIDRATAPHIPEVSLAEPLLKMVVPLPPEILEIAEIPEKDRSEEQRVIWTEWHGRVKQKTIPHIQRFKELYREEPTDMTVGHHVERFLARKMVEVEAGEISPGRYESYRCEIEAFRDWFGGERLIKDLNAARLEDYLVHLRTEITRGAIAAKTAAERLKTAKQFIRGLWETELIALPRNIDSRKMRLTVPAPDKKTIPISELKKLLKEAHGRARLYLLLMLNCGFLQTDIATLRHDEVDWKQGRIKRRRSKTRAHERVPEVDYLLWKETLRLLRQHRSNHETLALVNEDGNPLRSERIVEGKNKVNDAIKSVYWRLQKRTKTAYPLKLLRKTASTLMAGHDVYGRYVQHFLGHAPATVAEKHYVVPSQAQFDKAILWLGQQLGVEKR